MVLKVVLRPRKKMISPRSNQKVLYYLSNLPRCSAGCFLSNPFTFLFLLFMNESLPLPLPLPLPRSVVARDPVPPLPRKPSSLCLKLSRRSRKPKCRTVVILCFLSILPMCFFTCSSLYAHPTYSGSPKKLLEMSVWWIFSPSWGNLSRRSQQRSDGWSLPMDGLRRYEGLVRPHLDYHYPEVVRNWHCLPSYQNLACGPYPEGPVLGFTNSFPILPMTLLHRINRFQNTWNELTRACLGCIFCKIVCLAVRRNGEEASQSDSYYRCGKGKNADDRISSEFPWSVGEAADRLSIRFGIFCQKQVPPLKKLFSYPLAIS